MGREDLVRVYVHRFPQERCMGVCTSACVYMLCVCVCVCVNVRCNALSTYELQERNQWTLFCPSL